MNLSEGVSMDNTQKFSGKGDVYELSRPTYAPDLIEWLKNTLNLGPHSRIADVGAGTGKLTRQLLSTGATVFSVEPNADMRAKAIAILSEHANFQPIAAPAENTGLPAHSIDLITAASAFHWFDAKAFRLECQRLLVPDGQVCLMWNHRKLDNEVNLAFREIFAKYCPNFSGFSFERQEGHRQIEGFFNGKVTEKRFDNPVRYDIAGFVGRARSASYAIIPGDDGYEDFIEALEKLFYQHAQDGYIDVPHQSVAFLGHV